MRVYDGFTYNGESGMLRLRVEELRDVVDLHIIVESTTTFSGKARTICYDPGAIPHDLRAKIVHVIVDDMPEAGDDAWAREYHQRDAISRGLPADAAEEDLLIISDVDEIPNPKAIIWLITQSPLRGVWAFAMDFYYYDTHHLKAQKWFHARAVTALCDAPPSVVRRGGIDGGIVPVHGGWHLSYFMTPELISEKIKSFSHQEYNKPEFTDTVAITDRILKKMDLFDRPGEDFVPTTHDTELPVHIRLLG